MKKSWPLVRLGEVISHRKAFITIDDLTVYSRPRVQLHAKGIVLRDSVPGAEIKTKTQQVCRSGEFLVAEIDAKVGGFGIVPKELDSSIVSSHYFLFTIDESRLERGFLDYYSRTRIFREQVEAQGTTNYAAIRPTHVLGYEIPLPSLDEQCRIVARIEELAAQINEAKALRQQAVEEAEALSVSYLKEIRTSELGDAIPIAKCCKMSTGTTPPSEIGDYFGGAIPWFTPGDLGKIKNLKKSTRTLTDLAVQNKKARLFPPDTILLVAIGGSLGKTGICRSACSANQQITGLIFDERILPDFAYWWIKGLASEFMAGASQATLPIINQEGIGRFTIQIPQLFKQCEIIDKLEELQTAIDNLKCLYLETAAELDALLPALLDRAFKGEL